MIMKTETSRLLLYPLGDKEMEALIENENDSDLKQAYSEMLQGCVRYPENRIWYAVWLMELRSSPGTVVGDFCFKGLNPDGMVEIGYGLRDGFCGNGYMTEALKTITEWALSQPGVTRVEAETAPDNTPSQKVLASCGFVPNGTVGEEGPRFVFVK
ncbi:MAG: GNAT family N-acetyltransferase [Clostridia bacterium]|nr:GNAT family N-acetyltransferase [Clostridia bacterium]